MEYLPLIVIAISPLVALYRIYNQRNWIQQTARVASLGPPREDGEGGTLQSYNFPVITFSTQEGTKVFKEKLSGTLGIGDELGIIYNPEEPNHFYLSSPFHRFFFELSLFGIGCFTYVAMLYTS